MSYTIFNLYNVYVRGCNKFFEKHRAIARSRDDAAISVASEVLRSRVANFTHLGFETMSSNSNLNVCSTKAMQEKVR